MSARPVLTPAPVRRHLEQPFSLAHSRRVGRTTARIAAEMGLSPTYIELLREAAPLHDVGKLAIPRGVLDKPGPLTPDERALMQTHAEAGARIIGDSDVPILRMAAEIAVSHHERWDGAGYPRGLKGEEIPLPARIVAVADVLDALTHDRSYKPAWPLAEAIAEIAANSGSQFDPSVVEAFLASHGRPTALESQRGRRTSGRHGGGRSRAARARASNMRPANGA